MNLTSRDMVCNIHSRIVDVIGFDTN